jgi:hypothetical protein
MSLLKKASRIPIVPILFLTLVPIIAHLLFSSLGYDPKADGFTLAYSRRIIEGQIVHRDFITIRPILSPLLHVPFVLWGGDYTYWFSRLFVWFQFGCITWVWTSLIEKKVIKQSFGMLEKVLIALIIFAASVFEFPIMAWHTIDGLFFISLGIALNLSEKPSNKIIGYFLVSLAYLCKQSFILVAPLTLIIFGDWRKIKYWLSILLPGILYIDFLVITHALPDAVLQLTSQINIVSPGILAYLNNDVLIGVVIGYLSTLLAFGGTKIKLLKNNPRLGQLLFVVLLAIPFIGLAMILIAGRSIFPTSFRLFGLIVGMICWILLEKIEKPARIFYRSTRLQSPSIKVWKEWLGLLTLSLLPILAMIYICFSGMLFFPPSFGLFGIVIGVVGCLMLEKVQKPVGIAILVLIIAWSVSLSIGYNSPVLGSGALIAVLLAYSYPVIQQKMEKYDCKIICTMALMLMSVIVIVSFGVARTQYIFLDQAASNLTERLDGVLPGGYGIRTNKNTYAFLVDLQKAIKVSQTLGNTYSIIPDCPGWWAAAPQANPLPIDWTQSIELNRPELVRRVTQKLESIRNTNIVIVQKVEAKMLKWGFTPLSNEYEVVNYVRAHFTKVYETSYFELFR